MKYKYIIINILIITILTGCKENIKDIGNSSTVTKDEFELTISTAKNVYDIDKLFSSKPLDIIATIRYLGDKDKITIWHGRPIVAISLRHKNKKLDLDAIIEQELNSSIIKRNEKYLFSQSFSSDHYKEHIIKGDYNAIAYISVALDEKYKQIIEFSVEVPFSIK